MQAQQTSTTIHSKLSGPISSLADLERSLLFAELSMLSYLSHKEVSRLVANLGFHTVHFYDRDGAQAYAFISEHDHVIACRGTEPNEWNDLKADLDAQTALAETVGRVHRGFKKEVDDLWPVLEQSLINNEKPLWFTGHSLGGAMATICAGRCFLSHINSMPEELQTFGSPRVGNKRYINFVTLNYKRWVNNNDVVTRVPPAWLGYRHTGEEVYINADLKLQQLSAVDRSADLWKGFVNGLKKGQLDHFNDHLIDRYVEAIYLALQEQSPS